MIKNIKIAGLIVFVGVAATAFTAHAAEQANYDLSKFMPSAYVHQQVGFDPERREKKREQINAYKHRFDSDYGNAEINSPSKLTNPRIDTDEDYK